jgi:hypothetical protein
MRFGISGAAGMSFGCLLIIINACGMLCYIDSDMAVFMLEMWHAVDVRCVWLCYVVWHLLS